MSSPLLTLAAIGILTGSCGSRSSDTFLEPSPAPAGGAGRGLGASGSTDHGPPAAGGGEIGASGFAGTAGVGGTLAARDSGVHAESGALSTISPSEFLDRLALWLDGSFGLVRTDDGIISIWIDRTANGNDAYADTQRPHRELIAGSKTLGVVIFDGHALMTIADSPTLQWGTDDYTIEVVASYVNDARPGAASRACLYEKTSTVDPFYGVSFTGNAPLFGGAAQPLVSAISSSIAAGSGVNPRTNVAGKTMGVNNGAFHLFGTRRTAVRTLEVRLDGALDGIISNVEPANVSAAGQPVHIGGVPGPAGGATDLLTGRIAEIIAIHGPITDTELARLEAYLKGKYGI